jgi:putative membrane protein
MALHMLQDVILLFIAPLPALFALRAQEWRAPGGIPGRLLAVATHPAASMLHFNLAVGWWHLPPVYQVTIGAPGWAALMYASFFLAGTCFWWVIVEPLRRAARLPDPVSKIGYLVVAGVPPTVPGILLALSNSPLYPYLATVDDQQIAGLLLFGAAKLVLLLSMGILFVRLFRSDGDEGDWGSEGTHVPPGPNGIPAWVLSLQDPALRLAREPAPTRVGPGSLTRDASQDRQPDGR